MIYYKNYVVQENDLLLFITKAKPQYSYIQLYKLYKKNAKFRQECKELFKGIIEKKLYKKLYKKDNEYLVSL